MKIKLGNNNKLNFGLLNVIQMKMIKRSKRRISYFLEASSPANFFDQGAKNGERERERTRKRERERERQREIEREKKCV